MDIVTVVEYYAPSWSNREEPRPLVFVDRDDAIRSARSWAAKLAVDKLGSFSAKHINDSKDIQFTLSYQNSLDPSIIMEKEVALLFDAELI